MAIENDLTDCNVEHHALAIYFLKHCSCPSHLEIIVLKLQDQNHCDEIVKKTFIHIHIHIHLCTRACAVI